MDVNHVGEEENGRQKILGGGGVKVKNIYVRLREEARLASSMLPRIYFFSKINHLLPNYLENLA